MKCPYCGHLGDKVVDSRESREGDVIRRRRQCLECGKRFTSRERIEEIEYRVVKKDGNREPFQRQKLIAGLLRACEKRPVSVQELESIADRIEADLQDRLISVDDTRSRVTGVAPEWLEGLYAGSDVDLWIPLDDTSLLESE